MSTRPRRAKLPTATLVLLYPFLYAAVRVLHMAEDNEGEYVLGDLVLCLAVTTACVGAIFAVVALGIKVIRGRRDGALAALGTFMFVVALFGRRSLHKLGIGLPLKAWHIGMAVAGTGVGAFLVWWFARHPRQLRNVSVFFTLTGTLLVLRMIAGIMVDWVRARGAVSNSAIAREFARPIQGPDTVPRPVRNIYLIVLDEYASAAVLRERFGFDNRPFEDSLRALGFHVPLVHSNYPITNLSLPSLLNAAHVHRVGRELAQGTTDPTLPRYLLEQSRVVSFLRRRGYRFILFPSAWFGGTRSSPLADSVVQVWRRFDLHRAASQTELRRAILEETLLQPLHDGSVYGEHARRTLAEFSRLPSSPGPIFAFAHVMSPHDPWVFNRSCGKVSRSHAERTPARSYIGQLECVNRMVLHLVGGLLRESKVPPVILLQGDHGTRLLEYQHAPCPAQIPAAAARERMGAFGAYYLPGGGAKAFGDTVTIVNVLGNVLRYYFHVTLPREPDDEYLSVGRAPFELLRVDPAWLEGNIPNPSLSLRGKGCS